MDSITVALDPPQCNAVISLVDFDEYQTAPEEVGTSIHKLFDAALSHRLRYPKVRLRASAGQVVVLKRASKRSHYPGSVQITGDGDSFYKRTYFGAIGINGMLYPSRAMTPTIRELIGRMAADPVATALEQAKVTGRCMFCWKQLTDPRSVCHGHGKRCAEIWGLHWDAPRSFRGLFGDVWSAVSGAEIGA